MHKDKIKNDRPGVAFPPPAEVDFDNEGFLCKLLIREAALAAAEMKALSRLSLCNQDLSGPIH